MQLPLNEVADLACGVLRTLGYDADEAESITEHLMDCEYRGVTYGGLARTLTLHERLARTGGRTTRKPSILHETANAARIDGADEVGYLVALDATRIAIDKASRHGLGIVGAANTWCSGMSSFYLEQVAAKELIGITVSSVDAFVAPYGSTEAKLGTNPAAIVFPTSGEPVIWDIGTSAVMLAEATLAARTGQRLKPGLAFAPDGTPTTDPQAALDGAFAAWGGHKGSGLSVMIQMLGFLAGAQVDPDYLTDHGFLMIVIDPAIFGDAAGVIENATKFADSVRAARPLDPDVPVRLPFDGSRERRARVLQRGWLEVDDVVVERARQIIDG
jgi:LDH2 family malate/lactate/ureidoglycolate dehydrogenase